MSFIDEIKIYVKAGDGGNGAASFRREKFIEFGGPDGGNGGKGGDVVFLAVSNKNTLLHMRYMQHIIAENGSSGRKRKKYGNEGEDKIVPLPLGTQIYDINNNFIVDLAVEGQKKIIAVGGKGGAGNACFKSSTNQAPKFAVEGAKGEEKKLILKLKLIADVGLVGMPNVGKSTFLSYCTNSKPKISNYPFTTLEPNLGMVVVDDLDFVIADVPGIIKGATDGCGLGKKFLKHIERCGIIIHMVDSSVDNPVQEYSIIYDELLKYNDAICKKQSFIVLTKTDLVSSHMLNKIITDMQNFTKKEVYTLSYGDGKNLIIKKMMSILESINSETKEKYIYDPSK